MPKCLEEITMLSTVSVLNIMQIPFSPQSAYVVVSGSVCQHIT